MVAVKQDGSALEYASDRLKVDKKIVLEALKQTDKALEFANIQDLLKNDFEFKMELVREVGYSEVYSDDFYLIRMNYLGVYTDRISKL